jgi:ABC-type uncharacterized transport system substrate-binding protein
MRNRNVAWYGWAARWALYATCIGLTSQAYAHPHGSIECKGQVQLEAGRVQALHGELLLDAWHSQQAIALLRDASGQVDAQRLQRFVFALKMQIGRINWMFDVKADGENVDIQPKTDPTVDIVNERIRIRIDYAPDPAATPARRFSLNCNDPTYYYVTAFGKTIAVAPPDGVLRNEVDPAQLAAKLAQIGTVEASPSAVTVQGCSQLRMGVLDEKLGAPRAGMARMDWVCER